jgi:F0F1-type ATP synthase epsilon subunit
MPPAPAPQVTNAPVSQMQVIVISPDSVEWQGIAVEVESENSEGPFSILPDHTRYITIINNHPITFILPDSTTKVFHFKTSVLVVDDNTVTVYVHIVDDIYNDISDKK